MPHRPSPRREAAETDDLVRLYLDDIGRYPLLTKEDETRLGRRIEAGAAARAELAGTPAPNGRRRRVLLAADADGAAAAREFVNANLRLVVSVARRYGSSGLPLLDLVQEGNLGLVHAVEKFDWRKGFKFSTYATWWIRQAIQRGIANSRRTIRLPVHADERLRAVVRARLDLEGELGRLPTSEELAARTGLPEAAVVETLGFGTDVRSLSERAAPDSETEMGELLRDPAAPDPAEEAARSLLATEVERLLACLAPRERHVLRLRFGLDGGGPRPTTEVAAMVDATVEAVRHLEGRALAKLRHPAAGVETHELLAG